MLRWRLAKFFRRQQDQIPEPVAPSDIKSISNADLSERDIRDARVGWDPLGIQAFALSFNAYQHWGSFEKCATVANNPWTKNLDTLTLTELRTTLFFRVFCIFSG